MVDLVAGSETFHLDVTATNNLNGLVDAINNAGAGLTASIVNVSGDNYLSVSGASAIQLNDLQAPVNLIANSNAGSNADFMLNNTIHVVRPSNVVNDIIPGVSFTLKNNTAGSFTLSLSASQSQLANALQNFVNSYNTLLDSVTQQIGSSAGPLSGDLLVRTISTDMQQLATYWNTGSSIRSLSDLGVTFEDTSGHLSFDTNTFNGLSATQVSDAYKFLGSSKSGLAMLAQNFTQLSDPVVGLIRTQEDGYDRVNVELTDQINSLQDRATAAQSAMVAKIQAADALVAQLQSQQNNVNASLTSLNYVLYGRQTNVNGL
jgi:flagellar hook-associated protein 2